ncbi:hypothetical protein EUGRSUZ_A01494 [Eucalyptus grandis]|uniref:Uncharacterized protein n=2 Tax=Eucalyptus grandis TaxID=71139 RepID=A0ACC3M2Y8_EUCGR|nr:hypothetical protein EUGRSUZ_A01494 [Eucalyptus grandis]
MRKEHVSLDNFTDERMVQIQMNRTSTATATTTRTSTATKIDLKKSQSHVGKDNSWRVKPTSAISPARKVHELSRTKSNAPRPVPDPTQQRTQDGPKPRRKHKATSQSP